MGVNIGQYGMMMMEYPCSKGKMRLSAAEDQLKLAVLFTPPYLIICFPHLPILVSPPNILSYDILSPS